MSLALDLAVSSLILAAAFFLVTGSLGLVVLPSLMQRLHAPTMATTLGIGGLLIASIAFSWMERGAPSLREPVIALFLALTAPVTAQMIAKAYLLRDPKARRRLPPTGSGAAWATEPTAAGDDRDS